MMRAWSLAAAASVAVAILAGCPGSAVRDDTRLTAQLIATARTRGALRCAPVELAMAEAHYDSANHELDEGNYTIARDAAGIARENAQLAIEKSPPEKCTTPTKIGDADGDGILDNVDKCPHEAEDKDGFQDEDGCPDPDNDGDGILDVDDKCPNEPEDHDGFADDDGCPDPDNDGDGLYDALDQCPNEAEDKDGFPGRGRLPRSRQ